MHAHTRTRPLASKSWKGITGAGSTRSSRSSAGEKRRVGKLPWSCGVPANISTRSAWLYRKAWRISRRWPSTTELLSRLRPKPCAGRRFDAESEQLRRVAPDTHHPRTGVCSDDRAQRLDHQRLGDRLELPADSLGVRLSVAMADDHANTVAAVDLARQLDDPVQRPVEGANPLQRSDEAVADAQNRLDLQHRAEKRAGRPDPSSPP